jgi:hypothetical protein
VGALERRDARRFKIAWRLLGAITALPMMAVDGCRALKRHRKLR